MSWKFGRSLVSLGIAIVVIGLAFVSPLAEAAVIKPGSVTTSIAGDAGSSHLFLLDANGGNTNLNLQRPTGSEVALNTGASLADALATVHERSGTAHDESWTNTTGAGNPVFVFDLGADTSVGSILLWQYGNGSPGNSARDFELIFHTNAEGAVFSFASAGGTEATEFSGTMDAALPGTTDNNVAQFFGFGSSETARYIALRIATNYNGIESPGGDRYGLGEVRFASELVVPEPAGFAVLMLGLFGLGLMRRRRHR